LTRPPLRRHEWRREIVVVVTVTSDRVHIVSERSVGLRRGCVAHLVGRRFVDLLHHRQTGAWFEFCGDAFGGRFSFRIALYDLREFVREGARQR
jgi:hypothetical protein